MNIIEFAKLTDFTEIIEITKIIEYTKFIELNPGYTSNSVPWLLEYFFDNYCTVIASNFWYAPFTKSASSASEILSAAAVLT